MLASSPTASTSTQVTATLPASSAATSAGATTGSTTSPSSVLDSSGFMKLLLVQLQNQDPSQPMSSTEMMQQMIGIENINQLHNLDSAISSLTKAQAVSAAQLVGHTVQVLDSTSGARVTGKVDSVQIASGQASLMIGGKAYSMDSLSSIQP